jgi:hypothetical protein
MERVEFIRFCLDGSERGVNLGAVRDPIPFFFKKVNQFIKQAKKNSYAFSR